MGGESFSNFGVSSQKVAVFDGSVSPKCSSEFACVRAFLNEFNFCDYDGLLIRVRTDGKKYRFRLIYADDDQGYAYQHTFQTPAHEWQEVRLPFDRFKACSRGTIPPNANVLETKKVRQIGILIADEQAGIFKLECDWIKVYNETND